MVALRLIDSPRRWGRLLLRQIPARLIVCPFSPSPLPGAVRGEGDGKTGCVSPTAFGEARRVRFSTVSRITVLLLAFCLGSSGSASADVIRLLNGGEIRGELLAEAEEDSAVTIETLSGTIISVDEDAIEYVQRRSRLIEEYTTRSRLVPDTVEARWELAEWCRANLLREQREEQLELLLEIDPDHEDARRILQHVQHNGEWITRDELMTRRGYVRHKGKWITRQELELIQEQEAERNAELVWYPQVRLWFRWVTGNHAGRKAEGMSHLEELTDPDAVPALQNFMEEHESRSVRRLFVRILGRMQGPKPVQPLLDRYLLDSDEVVRQEALTGIKQEQFRFAFPYLVNALQHKANAPIRRSASALAIIGDEKAVPALINALVTTHTYKFQVPVQSGMTFQTGSNGRTQLVDPRSFEAMLPPELALMARAGQLPFGAVINAPDTPRRMRTVKLKADIKNDEVLSALVSLTGKDFGFNQRNWQLWWAEENG
jgi:hypothetical protein